MQNDTQMQPKSNTTLPEISSTTMPDTEVSGSTSKSGKSRDDFGALQAIWHRLTFAVRSVLPRVDDVRLIGAVGVAIASQLNGNALVVSAGELTTR